MRARHPQRDEATALAAVIGVTEAASRLGINRVMIARWCRQDGVQQAPGGRPGPRSGYRRGDCAFHVPDEQGCLAVTCWCEATVFAVPADDVVAGRTRSCGRPGCHEPEQAAS